MRDWPGHSCSVFLILQMFVFIYWSLRVEAKKEKKLVVLMARNIQVKSTSHDLNQWVEFGQLSWRWFSCLSCDLSMKFCDNRWACMGGDGNPTFDTFPVGAVTCLFLVFIQLLTIITYYHLLSSSFCQNTIFHVQS